MEESREYGDRRDEQSRNSLRRGGLANDNVGYTNSKYRQLKGITTCSRELKRGNRGKSRIKYYCTGAEPHNNPKANRAPSNSDAAASRPPATVEDDLLLLGWMCNREAGRSP